MARNFYYGKDADIVAGSANFAALITAAPTTYGLSAAQATDFSALDATLQSAYTDAVSPTTRSPVSIQAKDQAIRGMRESAVNLAKIAYSTTTVSDTQLVALGLLPRPSRAPVPPPAEAPVIDIVSTSGNTVTLRLHAADDSTRRGKPAGVDGASIFSFIGAAPPDTEDGWTFQGMASRTSVDITFPAGTAPGAKVWFTAFWFNSRKQQGPAALSVGTNIPGNAAMAA
jgi:hypothetical protein